MNVPENLRYTKDHEWAFAEGDVATLGITDYAQSELGDIVYIEFPNIGDAFSKGDAIGTIEAVKTVADIFTPLSCELIEINEALKDASELVNKDPYGEGWIAKIKLVDPSEIDTLLSPEEYKKLIS
jgi:glycine cleavage system H protein